MSLFHVGLDVGSTTIKLVVLNGSFQLIYGTYQRPFSDVRKTVNQVIMEGYKTFKNERITIMVTGSGGLSVNDWLDIEFIQEVVPQQREFKPLYLKQKWL